MCPLLPGQRLNILEVPHESGSPHNIDSADVFTRNPKDKFLTPVPPVPPKPLPSPRLGDLCREPYTVPMGSLTTPRSATYPYATPAYSPGYVRHARSASTTPATTSTALFSDFKCLKERFAQKRSASHAKAGSRNVRDLGIGAPTLISTTAEEVNLVPLPQLPRIPTATPLPTPPTSRSLPTPTAPQTSASLPESIRAKLREFSPLGSHPVDPADGSNPSSPSVTLPDKQHHGGRPRSRSEVAPTTAGSHWAPVSLGRANTMETRRTKLFSNEPWISSPRLPRQYEIDPEASAENSESAPALQRPSATLEPPSTDARPTSSHGSDRSLALRNSALDKDKALPPLPRYLVPAPLYACNSPTPSPIFQTEPQEAEYEEIQIEDTRFQMLSDRNGHYSIRSSESQAFSSLASDDDDEVTSPTFSSLTSDCSDAGSPHRFSLFSISDYIHSPNRDSTFTDEAFDEQEQQGDPAMEEHISTSPPKLGESRPSSFGPSLFDLDIQHTKSAPRRQAACFGLGFENYQLPDETSSKTTITEPKFQTQPAIHHGRGHSTSHAEKLVNEFGYLSDAVI